MPFSIESELLLIRATSPSWEATLRQRLGEFDYYLQTQYPYRLRDDSRLAYLFVSGNLPGWRGDEVLHECACVQYLCEATPYSSLTEAVNREVVTRLKKEAGIRDWKRAYELTPLVCDALKYLCLHEANLCIGTPLPWWQPIPSPGEGETQIETVPSPTRVTHGEGEGGK